ncbi:Transcriptional regulator, LysR family (fragment) [Rhizobium mesoamericanum STM3625]|uniref:Transcriptional regulator, LysR family n=1 Tax=Rhizobium mesoamericanum STM3625 TaxID=1211777 RepID=K0PRL6_9HYPH
MYAAPLMVARSDLIATIMEGVVTRSGFKNEPILLPLSLPPVPFVMSWHRRNEVHPVQQWMRDLLVELASSIHQSHALI